MKGRLLLVALPIAAVVAACTTIPAGGEAVQSTEIKSMISGYTWSWTGGGPGAGIYFAPDGTALIKFDGKISNTTWSTKDGAYCYQARSGDRCWALFRKDGELYSFSMWQSEYRTPYEWRYTAEKLTRGKHV